MSTRPTHDNNSTHNQSHYTPMNHSLSPQPLSNDFMYSPMSECDSHEFNTNISLKDNPTSFFTSRPPALNKVSTVLYHARAALLGRKYTQCGLYLNTIYSLLLDQDIYDKDLIVFLQEYYQKRIKSLRVSYRKLYTELQNNIKNEEYGSILQREIQVNTADIVVVCKEAISKLEEIVHQKKNSDITPLQNLIADYYRYCCEVLTGEQQKTMIDSCYEWYEKAYENCVQSRTVQYPPNHPFRLQLTLTFAKFLVVYQHNAHYACEICERIFDSAVTLEINQSPALNFNEVTLLLQEIRDQLTLWKSCTTPN